MQKPEPAKKIGYLLYDEGKREDYQKEMEVYNAHIASLRKLPCSPEAVNSFRHGGVYEEGKDYEVIWHYYGPDEKEPRAVPIDSSKGEDIESMRFTLDEVLEYVADFGRHVLKNKNAQWDMSNDSAEWLYDRVKETRK